MHLLAVSFFKGFLTDFPKYHTSDWYTTWGYSLLKNPLIWTCRLDFSVFIFVELFDIGITVFCMLLNKVHDKWDLLIESIIFEILLNVLTVYRIALDIITCPAPILFTMGYLCHICICLLCYFIEDFVEFLQRQFLVSSYN